jgi:hypothetical protein
MAQQRENLVTLFVAAVAILVIIGGYASFSGLASYESPLKIELSKESYSQSDVFDANVLLTPVTLFSDETIMIYIDGRAIGVIAIKKYLDDNRIEYGTETKDAGKTTVEIINMKSRLKVNLADYVTLDSLGLEEHTVRVEFSKGEAFSEKSFRIE